MANERNVLTFLDEILGLIQTKIATTDARLDLKYAAISLSEELWPNAAKPSQRYLLIVPGPQRPDQGLIRGGGLAATLMRGEVGIILWTRLWTDAGHMGDQAKLTDTSKGSLQMIRRIMKSLQMFDPTNADTNYYLAEPMRLSDPGWMTRKPKGPSEYAPLSASFEISYLADLTTA